MGKNRSGLENIDRKENKEEEEEEKKMKNCV
jgi:hypothetical protein